MNGVQNRSRLFSVFLDLDLVFEALQLSHVLLGLGDLKVRHQDQSQRSESLKGRGRKKKEKRKEEITLRAF